LSVLDIARDEHYANYKEQNMPIPADDGMPTSPKENIKAVIKSAMKGGPAAILSALEDKGYQVTSTMGEEPLDEEAMPAGMRAERNPPEGTGMDTASAGEPMSVDQIGSELFEKYMGPKSSAT
tara:strand:- start:3442 stop:3810 length:369 start_codon:yes stop_codon:yes gene_type:complete